MQYPLFPITVENKNLLPLTIRELPLSDQPGNRLKYLGSSSLSLRELLAILVGGDQGFQIAERILRHAHSSAQLASLSFCELTAIHGVGPTTAARIQAAFGLAQRMQAETRQELPQIHTPADVANLLMLEMGLLDHEQLRVVLLDTKNRVQDIVLLYKGSLNTAVVRVGEVFKEALRRNVAAIVLVHNHPSTDPAPSPEDVRLTEKVVDAGRLLNIDVLDHLVVTSSRFVSLKERGLGF
jgi:DNA repair protein RadC